MIPSPSSEAKTFFSDLKILDLHNSGNQATVIAEINNQKGIILISTPTFTEELVTTILQNHVRCESDIQNDVYKCYNLAANADFRVRTIYPASEDDLRKYSKRNFVFFEEDYNDYCCRINKALINESTRSNWIRNLINNVKNTENINSSNNNDSEKANLKHTNTEVILTGEKIDQQIVNHENNIKNTESSQNIEEIRTNQKIESNLTKKLKSNASDTEKSEAQLKDCNKLEKSSIEDKTNISNNGDTKSSYKKPKLESDDKKFNERKDFKYNPEDLKHLQLEMQVPNKNGELSTVKETIFYSDENFLIIPNYHWDMKSVENLYLVLIFKRENLYTIREIENISLLKEAKEKALFVCKKYFNLHEKNIYMFFHYHPTFYSLHLHVCNSNYFGMSSMLGRAILLEDVINNIETDKEYYKKNILRFRSYE
ncbi:hypothetical protein EDEG_02761 [Edhazardia aedis USNM 41457]|uniref:HIT domain-containing protein n=1 Tax=Edhazardia aedis (strain USNM 41457) TaxID=1003232 RepID=J8ZT49_EDHAE|nr:hypothetical protein EDEG_02761 [Edhazardia aedis USNM 41457]|eukprot:EJW02848.1 hypothetical protein EDEG_02761 [Edhazardia aedis USNM 41457]